MRISVSEASEASTTGLPSQMTSCLIGQEGCDDGVGVVIVGDVDRRHDDNVKC